MIAAFFYVCRQGLALLRVRRASFPNADELKNGLSRERREYFANIRHFQFVIDVIEPKVQAGTLQEEAVLSALEDRITGGTNVLREASSIAILAALTITFFTLHRELPAIFAKQPDLKGVMTLVGANWPLIGLGLVLYFLSTVWYAMTTRIFLLYRSWLESAIFPFLGLSRSTSDQLVAALAQFNGTVASMNGSLAPLQGLGIVLQQFQTGLVQQLVPALERGLRGISVGLSDRAVSDLREFVGNASSLFKTVQDHEARMLTLAAATERRTAELAAAVDAISDSSRSTAENLAAQAVRLEANTDAVRGFTRVVQEHSSSLSAELAVLTRAAQQLVTDLEGHGGKLEALQGATADAADAVGDVAKLLPEISSLIESGVCETRNAIVPIIGLTEVVGSAVEVTRPVAEKFTDLIARWENAMLQMSSLADDIRSRTEAIENRSANLVSALDATRREVMPDLLNGLSTLSREIADLRSQTSKLAAGSEQIVSAFGNLQVLGQKMKTVGHSITGHFAVWERNTRDVFRKAEETAAAVTKSVERIEGTLSALHWDDNRRAQLDTSLERIVPVLQQIERQLSGRPAEAKSAMAGNINVNTGNSNSESPMRDEGH